MSKLPRFVPLTEVHEYTDAIKIGELGLPVGLDIDRLELNVKSAVKTARLGNIGELILSGGRGDKSEHSFSVSGADNSGTATAHAVSTVSKASLHKYTNSSSSKYPSGYNWKRVGIEINNSEVEERIRHDGDKWDLGLYDVNARAKYMNMALKKGLAEASIQSVFEDIDLKEFTQGALLIAFSYGVQRNLVHIDPGIYVPTLIGPSLVNFFNHNRDKIMYPLGLPNRQHSLLMYFPVDRLALSLGRGSLSKFIRAAKPKANS